MGLAAPFALAFVTFAMWTLCLRRRSLINEAARSADGASNSSDLIRASLPSKGPR
jgi:hypothetical protein